MAEVCSGTASSSWSWGALAERLDFKLIGGRLLVPRGDNKSLRFALAYDEMSEFAAGAIVSWK